MEGRFEILEEIGAGPLGRVVKAVDGPSGRPVALRLIDEPDANRAAAILAAARRAMAVGHPHVVKVLDAGQAGTRVWVAMELVSGRTLARVLEEDGPFPAERLVQVGLEICAGLEAHHRCSLVHRDLKPANVMMTAAGVKILDVGLAHACARTSTPPYASPEARHGYPVDERTDLYSLGVLLVELATGAGYTFDGNLDVPLALPAHVPPPLAAIIVRLLHLDPGARFRNASAAAEALRAVAGAPPARRGPRRRRRALGVGAILAVAGAALLVGIVRGRAGVSIPAVFAGCSAHTP